MTAYRQECGTGEILKHDDFILFLSVYFLAKFYSTLIERKDFITHDN